MMPFAASWSADKMNKGRCLLAMMLIGAVVMTVAAEEAEIEIAPAKGVAEQEKLDLSKDHFRLSQRRDSDNSMNTDAIQLGEQSGETCSDVMAGYRRNPAWRAIGGNLFGC